MNREYFEYNTFVKKLKENNIYDEFNKFTLNYLEKELGESTVYNVKQALINGKSYRYFAFDSRGYLKGLDEDTEKWMLKVNHINEDNEEQYQGFVDFENWKTADQYLDEINEEHYKITNTFIYDYFIQNHELWHSSKNQEIWDEFIKQNPSIKIKSLNELLNKEHSNTR